MSERFARFPSPHKELPLPPESQQGEVTFVLECVECGARDAVGRNWKAFVTSDDELLVYCDACAEREFGE
jgi:hypothetical protein